MKKLAKIIKRHCDFSEEESNIVAFNITIFALITAVGLIGVILNLVGII